MLIRIYLICLFCFGHFFIENAAQANQPISVAIGWDKPPYVMNQGTQGFEIEIIRDVLLVMGYEAQFVQIPYGRSYDIFNMPDIDAVATLSSKLEADRINLSDVYIRYQNVAVTLASSNLKLDTVEQMSGLSIVGFQSAYRLLGEAFSIMSIGNREYKEVPDQDRQVKLLLSNKTQAIVLDANIFNFLKLALEKKADKQAAVIHPLFAPNLYRVGFVELKLKFSFDKALADYLISQKYRQLVDKYQIFNAYFNEPLSIEQ